MKYKKKGGNNTFKYLYPSQTAVNSSHAVDVFPATRFLTIT